MKYIVPALALLGVTTLIGLVFYLPLIMMMIKWNKEERIKKETEALHGHAFGQYIDSLNRGEKK